MVVAVNADGSPIGGGGGGGSSVDRELVVTTYKCKIAFEGASVGDTITQTQVIDLTGTPSTVSTIWRNQTTGADLAGAPSGTDIESLGGSVGLLQGGNPVDGLNPVPTYLANNDNMFDGQLRQGADYVDSSNPVPMTLYSGGAEIGTSGNPISVSQVGTTTQAGRSSFSDLTPVVIDSPTLPFGAIHAEKLTPVFQSDGVYGINAGHVVTDNKLGGNVSSVDSAFRVNTGAGIGGRAVMQARKRLRYRAGQGVVLRTAGLFGNLHNTKNLFLGLSNGEDSLMIGYKAKTNLAEPPEFGILYENRGVRQVYLLNLGVASAGAATAIIVLEGFTHVVSLSASTSSSQLAHEIAAFSYTGWKAEAEGSSVRFIRNWYGPVAAVDVSFTSTKVAGSWFNLKTGAIPSEREFITQPNWNGDKLDGTGPSGITFDPLKGNVLQFGIQYLGFGALGIYFEVCPEDNHKAYFTLVHIIRAPNERTKTTFGNPSFQFTVLAESTTTNVTDSYIDVGSFAGFIEGTKSLHGNRFSYERTATDVGDVNLRPVVTIYNRLIYNNKANNAVVNLLDVTASLKHTSPCLLYLIRNGTLTGGANFVSVTSNSCTLEDKSATGITYSSRDQLLWTGHLGDTGQIIHVFGAPGDINGEEITIQPGEWVTLAARSVIGTPAYVTGSINTREDQ